MWLILQIFLNMIIKNVVYVCRFAEGEAVTVEIDQARRRLNARIHSAGHLLDSALIRLGMTDLVPSKVGPAKTTNNDHFTRPVL